MVQLSSHSWTRTLLMTITMIPCLNAKLLKGVTKTFEAAFCIIYKQYFKGMILRSCFLFYGLLPLQKLLYCIYLILPAFNVIRQMVDGSVFFIVLKFLYTFMSQKYFCIKLIALVSRYNQASLQMFSARSKSKRLHIAYI